MSDMLRAWLLLAQVGTEPINEPTTRHAAEGSVWLWTLVVVVVLVQLVALIVASVNGEARLGMNDMFQEEGGQRPWRPIPWPTTGRT